MAGYIYGNKYNLCSGYFPDYIPLDDNAFTKLYSDNDTPKYYPYIFNGRYLKQIYNSNSKYNYNYLSKKRTAYAISKKFWGGSSPSSIGLVWTGRKFGLSPRSEIGARGSEIGTQGEQPNGRRLNTYTHTYTRTRTRAHTVCRGLLENAS